MDIIQKFKKDTSELHSLSERHELNKMLMSGQLSSDIYRCLLHNQLMIYSAIETNPNCPDVIKELKISYKISDDLGEYAYSESISSMDAYRYAQHLNDASQEALNPHIYLNYLQILYGGQMIKKVVPFGGSMYDIPNAKNVIGYIRNIQKDKLPTFYDKWVASVDLGYMYWIDIYNYCIVDIENGDQQ